MRFISQMNRIIIWFCPSLPAAAAAVIVGIAEREETWRSLEQVWYYDDDEMMNRLCQGLDELNSVHGWRGTGNNAGHHLWPSAMRMEEYHDDDDDGEGDKALCCTTSYSAIAIERNANHRGRLGRQTAYRPGVTGWRQRQVVWVAGGELVQFDEVRW